MTRGVQPSFNVSSASLHSECNVLVLLLDTRGGTPTFVSSDRLGGLAAQRQLDQNELVIVKGHNHLLTARRALKSRS